MDNCYFEAVERFAGQDITLPKRATIDSAGYDMYIAEDVIIPPYEILYNNITSASGFKTMEDLDTPRTLEEIASLVKKAEAKVSLVSTGVKCKLPSGYYLKLVARSSLPLKHWLIVANSVGIIDADYYGCANNDGEIFFQLINLSPFPIILKKGECIGQGIIQPYLTTINDTAAGERTGGFGSTTQ